MKATVQLESEPIYISTTESLRMMISLLKYNVTLWKHYSPGSPLSVKAWKRIQFSFPGNLFPPAYSSSSASVRLLRKLSVHFARNNFCNCCWPKTTIARIFLFIRYGTVLRQDCFFSFLWFHRHLLFHHNLRLLLDHAGDGLDLGYQGTIQQSKQNSQVWFYIICMDLDLQYLQQLFNIVYWPVLDLKKNVKVLMRLWIKLNTIISLSFGGWLAVPFCPPFDDLFADIFHSVLILHMKYK